jgi:glycerophosphoryl diester phosphodiesterase/HEAT repeat protein
MKATMVMLLALFGAGFAQAGVLLPGGVQLLCHRTANEDVPENTLESLDQAALLGCNVVEIDLRRTLDGKIVLNHDGIMERLTDGVGEAEASYYGDLQLRDAGSWMGQRFENLHMTLFQDALRLARDRDIRLVLDMKDKGLGAEVLQILEREGMLQRVQFNGEWDDVKKLYAAATDVGDGTVWVQPGVTEDQVKQYHRQGKAVVANFSANHHEMDLAGMKTAVAAGVDGINVDYPRLGADAVGRPVERRLHELMLKADSGDSGVRVSSILELSRYSGFPLQENFAHWLLDADDHVSRAAALALARARPGTPISAFSQALRCANADARSNAAWALGMLRAPASVLLPLLQDQDPHVLQSALLALARAPGDVNVDVLLPLLSYDDAAVRGAAAVALAQHQPDIAINAIPAQLQKEIIAERAIHDNSVSGGKPRFTQSEIDAIMKSFKCQMEMMRALAMLHGSDASLKLEELAFRPDEGLSSYDGVIAGFQLWDRIGADPAPAVEALGSSDQQVADRAEWMLVKANPAVLPKVRKALNSDNQAVRLRAMRIVAWQGDTDSLAALQAIQKTNTADAALAAWAVEKIQTLHPNGQ